MKQLSKIGMKFPNTKHGVLFFLRNDFTSWLGLDGRKLYDTRHAEDISWEFNTYQPFTVRIVTQEGEEKVSILDDFVSALLHGETTRTGTRAIIHDVNQDIAAEVECM